MLGVGDTLILRKPGSDTNHLWALITAPDPQSAQAVMVNLTTQKPHSDMTTVLQPGEHPFVNRATVVFYADARLVDVRTLEEGLRQGFTWRHAALSPRLLQRIQNGLMVAPLTPAKVRTWFNAARQKGLT